MESVSWTFGPGQPARRLFFRSGQKHWLWHCRAREGQYKSKQQTNQAASGAIGPKRKNFYSRAERFLHLLLTLTELREVKVHSAESVEDLGAGVDSDPQTARHNQNNLLRALLKGKVSDQVMPGADRHWTCMVSPLDGSLCDGHPAKVHWNWNQKCLICKNLPVLFLIRIKLVPDEIKVWKDYTIRFGFMICNLY